jgi:hypothetical protein
MLLLIFSYRELQQSSLSDDVEERERTEIAEIVDLAQFHVHRARSEGNSAQLLVHDLRLLAEEGRDYEVCDWIVRLRTTGRLGPNTDDELQELCRGYDSP